ncbi:MAG: peroxidase-related enzyme [Deltaproteobacteria bacterium]|nr:peroxidase-related enzyme [Deltaproteobacteria bacterium]NCP04325.1 peroxidase-related enzyme [Deltaproteobacteria bacterium]
MSRISLVSPEKASPEVETIYAEISQAFGKIPNLFKAYAHHPPLLEANWHKVKRVMMEGVLARKTKEAIALLVSQDNGCTYCVAAHTGALKMVGVSDDEIGRISADLDQADFSVKERALIRLARKANAAAHEVTAAEVDAVRQTGAGDAEIVEALGVMEVFTAFNKFLDVLDVDLG